MLPPAVLWVDPGKMTGMAAYFSPYVNRDVKRGFEFGEFPFLEACQRIEIACIAWGAHLAVGWERFTVNADTHKKTPQPDAMHVIGVCRYVTVKYGCRVLPEAQQATPDALEQRQLKAIGWWVPGKDDAQSAAAHMLRYLVRENELPPQEREILAALDKGDR